MPQCPQTYPAPDNVEHGRRDRPVPAIVEDEPRRTDDIHPLENGRPSRKLAQRHQNVGAKDEQRRCPSDGFYAENQQGAQAASFRST